MNSANIPLMRSMTRPTAPARYLLPLLALALAGIPSGWAQSTASALPLPLPPITHTPLAKPGSAAHAAAQPATELRQWSLRQLSGQTTIPLRTTEGRATFNFGSRADELVVKATLRLHYTHSPALIPGQSHIKVLLNDEIVGLLPITKETAGRPLVRDIDIDPRLVADFNRLTLQFVGHYTAECEDPLHTSLWTDVSGNSQILLGIRPLPLKNDLAMLPEPFFDRRDLGQLKLPFLFAAQPQHGTLRAAGVVASWFGKLAGWRGARFPASLDQLPKSHAVVFATNDQRPAFLAKYPAVKGPTLAIIDNPADDHSKLLLVLGRDNHDLDSAANALALGNAALSGSQLTVKDVQADSRRQAYDAPNWVRLDRPMKFGELVENAQELQAFGHVPDLIRLNLRIPPDLFTWRSRGVPVDLKYRYTPPIRSSESRLTMSINDELVQAFNLRASGQGGENNRVRLPLLDDGLLGDAREVLIPAFKLGSRNQIQYGFSFAYQKEGGCKDTQVENVRAMIDADSTVDFSGYPHYAEMPHLGYFATSGFPFTKYADLAETTVVLPKQPTAHDIETLLSVLGHMGESTGYPATRVIVTSPEDKAALKNRDLLLIGSTPGQSLLTQWGEHLPAIIDGTTRRLSQPQRSVSFLYDWLGFGTAPDTVVAQKTILEGNGPLAALLGFESPLSSERSVVAITATSPDQLPLALDALDNTGMAKSMHGSVVFLRPNKADSFLVGDTYTIGSLPWWTTLWFPLSGHPILLALMSVFAVLVFAFALWRSLRAVARRRMGQEDTQG
jgi:hypothetical protein